MDREEIDRVNSSLELTLHQDNSIVVWAIVCLSYPLIAMKGQAYSAEIAEEAFDLIDRVRGNRPELTHISEADRKLIIEAVGNRLIQIANSDWKA